MSSFLNEIGDVVVIGLEARKDRWERCLEICKMYDINPVTHYTTVCDYSDKHRHYMKDFLQMLRVKGNGEALVFFEDDFELVDGWEEVLKKAWKDLPIEWDMLYLGCNLTGDIKKVTNYQGEESKSLVKVQGAWLMHATILSKRFIKYILHNYDYNRIWIIDDWYRQQAPYRQFFMTYPMISYQRKDYSDFINAYTDYQIFENKFYKRI
jgi:hypothetical protein